MKNILHLSDLHFSISTKFGFHIDKSELLINTLISDINRQSISIDTIFITGDISFSGNKDEYESILKCFITPLLEKLELTTNDLYLVPGNHDMDRKNVPKIETITRKNSSEEEISEIYKGVNHQGDPWKRLDNYNSFADKIKKNQTNIIHDSALITVRELSRNLRVHCINSAWLACDEKDQGLLRVLPLLSETLKKYGKKNNILLMHHPLDWLSKNEINLVSKYIEKQVDAVFYGHMHEFEQSITINFNHDITLKLQAGTVDLRNSNAGYSLISLDSNNSFQYGRVSYRKYDSVNKEYQPWIERNENGYSDFSLDKRSIFDSSKFCERSSDLLNNLEYLHLINTGKLHSEKFKLSEIFIEPKFKKDDTFEDNLADIGTINNFEQLENVDGCILVSATEQQGRTTLLRKIQLSYLEAQSQYKLQNIVFYIDLNVEYSNHHKILEHLISSYGSADLKTSFDSKLKSCIDDGNAIFLVDNYDKCTELCLSSINKFIEGHTENKFIITGNAENNIDNLTKLSNVYSGLVHNAIISNIKRCDIREIISRRLINSPLHSDDELFNNLMKVVDNSQLPHNHFVYSILLIIYEENNTLVGILNEADIIENYIEILLHKHRMTVNQKIPEYKILLHLLGFVCSKLISQRKAFFSEKDFQKFIIEFESLTFQDFPLSSYIDPILDSGILISNGISSYEFSNTCFLHFFSAYYMGKNEELKDFVFSDKNYILLDKVVEYYASINSSNFDVLKFFENKVKITRGIISDEIYKNQNMCIESLNIDDIPAISLLDLASTSDEFEKSIDGFNVDQSKYDEERDEVSPLRGKNENVNVIGEPESIQDNTDVINNYKKEISILSKVFRSTELVMDPDEVMRIFDFILDSYVFLIKFDLANLNDSVVLPLLLPKLEKQMSENNVNQKEKDKMLNGFKVVLSLIRAFVPNVIADMLSNNLSTKKPRFINILNKKLEVDSISDMDELLIRFLLLDIERGKFKEHIKELDKNRGKVASNALFLKLMTLSYTRHDFKKEEKDFLQSKLLDLVKQNRSVNKKDINSLLLMK